MNFSIIQYYGKQQDRCGYCKGTKCSVSHGMHAYHMLPQDYQDLIDRGWRRSGMYCYKPYNKTTCCPCYTIKCSATEFKLSKSHKKILKRMTRFLRDGKRDKTDVDMAQPESGAGKVPHAVDSNGCASEGGACGGGALDEPVEPDVPRVAVNLEAVALANPARNAAAAEVNQEVAGEVGAEQKNQQMENKASSVASSGSRDGSKKSFDGQNPPCKKAKQMRLERRQAKLAAKGITEAVAEKAAQTKASKGNGNGEKTLSDYIAEASPSDKHKLKIVLVPSTSLQVTDAALKLYRKYQLQIHNDKPERLTPTSLQRFLYETPLQLKLVHVASKQFEQTLARTYAVYEKYQARVHNDPANTVKGYLEFLQQSPLKHTKTYDGPATGYGSFHQQYWLDEQLIAVAVIDILPSSISSVYFFYDPDYSFLSLGTYGSLREIAYVQELAAKVPALKYYYMGFYIHSCPKMRYKGKLQPSYLVCPETYTWHLLTDEIRDKLSAVKYQRFSSDPSERDAEEFRELHLDPVVLLLPNHKCITYREYIQSSHIKPLDNMFDIIRSRIYKQITGDDHERDLILEYGKLVGKSCAHRMFYWTESELLQNLPRTIKKK